MNRLRTTEQLTAWDEYRTFVRRGLKLLPPATTAIFVSKNRIEFEDAGRTWKGHAVVLGKGASATARKLRQDGVPMVGGLVTRQGRALRLSGLSTRLVEGARRTLARLRVGYAVAADSARDRSGNGADDRRRRRLARTLDLLAQVVKKSVDGPDLARLLESITQVRARLARPDADLERIEMFVRRIGLHARKLRASRGRVGPSKRPRVRLGQAGARRRMARALWRKVRARVRRRMRRLEQLIVEVEGQDGQDLVATLRSFDATLNVEPDTPERVRRLLADVTSNNRLRALESELAVNLQRPIARALRRVYRELAASESEAGSR